MGSTTLLNILVWLGVIATLVGAVIGIAYIVRAVVLEELEDRRTIAWLRRLRQQRDEKAMAREYGARMTRPLDDAQRAAVNEWLRGRRHDREGD